MIQLNQSSLSIVINDVEPAQRRERIIKALAASIRWNSRCKSKPIADDENLHELAQLIDELLNTEIQG